MLHGGVARSCGGGTIQALVGETPQPHVVADNVQHTHHLEGGGRGGGKGVTQI